MTATSNIIDDQSQPTSSKTMAANPETLRATMAASNIRTLPTANIEHQDASHEFSHRRLRTAHKDWTRGAYVSTISCADMMIGMTHGACRECKRSHCGSSSRGLKGIEQVPLFCPVGTIATVVLRRRDVR